MSSKQLLNRVIYQKTHIKYNADMSYEDDDLDTPDESPVVVPFCVKDALGTHILEPFTPIDVHATDEETTISDLQVLNNNLVVCAALLPHVRTIPNFCNLAVAVTKLIEMRRKVKKLPFGKEKGENSRGFEVLE